MLAQVIISRYIINFRCMHIIILYTYPLPLFATFHFILHVRKSNTKNYSKISYLTIIACVCVQLTSSRSLGSISEGESTTLGSVMIEGGSGSTLLRLLQNKKQYKHVNACSLVHRLPNLFENLGILNRGFGNEAIQLSIQQLYKN